MEIKHVSLNISIYSFDLLTISPQVKHFLEHRILVIETNDMNESVSRNRSQIDHNAYIRLDIYSFVLEPASQNATGYKEDDFYSLNNFPIGIESGGLDLNRNSTLGGTIYRM